MNPRLPAGNGVYLTQQLRTYIKRQRRAVPRRKGSALSHIDWLHYSKTAWEISTFCPQRLSMSVPLREKRAPSKYSG